MTAPSPEQCRLAASLLLEAAGAPAPFQLVALPGGPNNHVFRVDAAAARYIVKFYSQDATDRRRRLHSEFVFCEYAWRCGQTAAQKPLARLPGHNAALYEFIDGTAIDAGSVTPAHIVEVMDFWAGLNAPATVGLARDLPQASEACRTLADHCRCVQLRLARWAAGAIADPFELGVGSFVRQDVTTLWARIERTLEAAQDRDLSLPIDQAICPSDLGFLNVILEAGGRLRFIDFEYGGWDDPAKCLSDMILHPGVPLRPDLVPYITAVAAERLGGEVMRRLRTVLPIHAIKWCLIVLNEFMPGATPRARTDRVETDLRQRHVDQLQKARVFLERARQCGAASLALQ